MTSINIPVSATAGLPWKTHSNNESNSPTNIGEALASPNNGQQIRADGPTPFGIRFLHECTDELGTRTYDNTKGDLETPSSHSDNDQFPQNYGISTIFSKARHQRLLERKLKVLPQQNQKKEDNLLLDIHRLVHKLESSKNATVIDLLETIPSNSAVTSVTSDTTTYLRSTTKLQSANNWRYSITEDL